MGDGGRRGEGRCVPLGHQGLPPRPEEEEGPQGGAPRPAGARAGSRPEPVRCGRAGPGGGSQTGRQPGPGRLGSCGGLGAPSSRPVLRNHPRPVAARGQRQGARAARRFPPHGLPGPSVTGCACAQGQCPRLGRNEPVNPRSVLKQYFRCVLICRWLLLMIKNIRAWASPLECGRCAQRRSCGRCAPRAACRGRSPWPSRC